MSSLSVSTSSLDVAKESIRTFAEISPDATVVVTSNLELKEPWGFMKKIFHYISLREYYADFNPQKSTERFRERLFTVLSSKEFRHRQNQTALETVCDRACTSFNRIIRETNRRFPHESETAGHSLFVNFEDEKRRARTVPTPSCTQTSSTDEQEAKESFSTEYYNQLFGNVIPDLIPSSPQPIRGIISRGSKDSIFSNSTVGDLSSTTSPSSEWSPQQRPTDITKALPSIGKERSSSSVSPKSGGSENPFSPTTSETSPTPPPSSGESPLHPPTPTEKTATLIIEHLQEMVLSPQHNLSSPRLENRSQLPVTTSTSSSEDESLRNHKRKIKVKKWTSGRVPFTMTLRQKPVPTSALDHRSLKVN